MTLKLPVGPPPKGHADPFFEEWATHFYNWVTKVWWPHYYNQTASSGIKMGTDDHLAWDSTVLDLTPYTLVDGTRAFTGEVGGVDPLDKHSLATKEYVDTINVGMLSFIEKVDLIAGSTSGGLWSTSGNGQVIVVPNGYNINVWWASGRFTSGAVGGTTVDVLLRDISAGVDYTLCTATTGAALTVFTQAVASVPTSIALAVAPGPTTVQVGYKNTGANRLFLDYNSVACGFSLTPQ